MESMWLNKKEAPQQTLAIKNGSADVIHPVPIGEPPESSRCTNSVINIIVLALKE